ncbi:hypothetical protein AT15_07195 [Kosmotoga arenicorallina S304]|uniref:S-adenosyl-l-methionine hydroxide adenosyltransferase n=1 Tax=Kosmotoga arenicorallina S304 TaxID=1453497 RepID=A0A182C749_9BACT|nr:SAM-dependent chlorinase/fluorinase [Kosmotoga arenicorallina]OAA31274.1 hypothetical protein AT15_07195 [Kosmotoga arenicorallina S304]
MIAFLSDWGSESYYVGVAKAVMKKIAPSVEIIDITHGIKPFNIRMGAYILQRATPDFPDDTVFLAVVDPGVGSSRKAIAVKTKSGKIFVGPDNGLFTFVCEKYGVSEVRELSNLELHYGASDSFHGRDIFAAVTAHIAKGIHFSEIGDLLMSYEVLKFWKAYAEGANLIKGEAAFVDRFGNIETNIPGSLAKKLFDYDDKVVIAIGKKKFEGIFGRTYYDVRRGSLLIHEDSSGYLEIAVNQGDASETIGIQGGESLAIRRP